MKKSHLYSYIKENIVETLKNDPAIELQDMIWNFIKQYGNDPDTLSDILSTLDQMKKAVLSSLNSQTKVSEAGEKTAFINDTAIEYKDEKDLDKFKDNSDVKSIKTGSGKKLKEAEDDDDKEPTAAQINKKDSVSTLASKYRETTGLMKSLVKKYQSAEGEEKEKIKNQLKDLTKVKKELEKML